MPPKAQPALGNTNLARGLGLFAPSTQRKPDLKLVDLLASPPQGTSLPQVLSAPGKPIAPAAPKPIAPATPRASRPATKELPSPHGTSSATATTSASSEFSISPTSISPRFQVAPENHIVEAAPGKSTVPETPRDSESEDKETPSTSTISLFSSTSSATTAASSTSTPSTLPRPSPSPLSRDTPEDRIVDQAAPGTPSWVYPSMQFWGPQFSEYRDSNTDISDDDDDAEFSSLLSGSLGRAQCPIVDPVAPGTLPSPDDEGWMNFIANFEAKLSIGTPNQSPNLLPTMMECDWITKEFESDLDYHAVLVDWEEEQLARGEEGMLWELDGEYALGENLLTDVRQDRRREAMPTIHPEAVRRLWPGASKA
ncbi:uncharacterized protein BP5553_10616 [Venustampulla echinocandica]|uniref:Uncharacterized protein n=1 Tax=Venustampulla echinocandica TaxID=2656787 RepID=A0A370T919_9HELO|nr:uncharacterized protein BP5553_10616 [Venustampulla echinocandica]RDL29989.1 hypothetical protein BP5553_10616 [Venustampulla echinocandica]